MVGPGVFLPAVALPPCLGSAVSAWDAACRREQGLLRATSLLPIPSSAASYDKRIILWDIGVPNHDYEFQAR